MQFRIALIASLLVLGSCAYVMEEQVQDVMFETPGAENSVCYVYVDKLRHKVSPPQKINVTKSETDMVVDCLAPGNRRQKVVIKPALSKYTYGDVALGGAPLAWDWASRALYMYPDIVTVDFTNAQVLPEDLPAQNRPDVKQPEEYPLEEFLPGTPRMNADRYDLPPEFKRREKAAVSVTSSSSKMIETGSGSDKGNLKRAVNPSGPVSAPATAGPAAPETAGPARPVPAYPGQ